MLVGHFIKKFFVEFCEKMIVSLLMLWHGWALVVSTQGILLLFDIEHTDMNNKVCYRKQSVSCEEPVKLSTLLLTVVQFDHQVMSNGCNTIKMY
jgi:hypothetical protein